MVAFWWFGLQIKSKLKKTLPFFTAVFSMLCILKVDRERCFRIKGKIELIVQ